MPGPLPDRLSYLSRVIAELGKFDPDSLGDDNPEAQDIVEAAVRSRVRGMDEEEAKATVMQDCADLQEWLAQPGLETSPAHFLVGAMFGMTMWADFGELAGEDL